MCDGTDTIIFEYVFLSWMHVDNRIFDKAVHVYLCLKEKGMLVNDEHSLWYSRRVGNFVVTLKYKK